MAGLDDLNTDATNVTATLGAAALAMGKLQDQAKNVSLDGLMYLSVILNIVINGITITLN